MLAATKRLLVIIMAGMVILGIIGMFVVILGIIGVFVVILGIIGMCRIGIDMVGNIGIIDMVGTNGMCIVVILGMVIVGTVIEQAMGMVIKLGIVDIVTHTVGMNTVGLLVASNNLTFCVITAWSG